MKKPKLSSHERSLMPRWTVPRQFWRLRVTIGWLSKKPRQLGAIGSRELKIAYSKSLGEAMAMRSSQSATLHREHVRLMQELEEQAIREESKSHHNFLSACQAILHHTPQPLKENLTTSYHILLG